MFPVDGACSILFADKRDTKPLPSHSSRSPVISSRRIVHYDEQPPMCEPPGEPQSRSSEITTQTTREDTDVMSIEVATQLEMVSVADMSVGTCSIHSLPPEPQTITRKYSVTEAETQTPPNTPDSEAPHAATPPSLRSVFESPLSTVRQVTDAHTQTKEPVTPQHTEPIMRMQRNSVNNVKLGRSDEERPRSSEISADHVTSEGSSTLSLRPTMTTSMEMGLARDNSMVMRQKQVRSARARRIKHQGTGRVASTSEDEDRKRNMVTAAKSLPNGRPSGSDVDATSKMSALSLIVGRCLEVALREVRVVPEQRQISRTSELVNTYLSRAIAEDDAAQRRDATSPLIVNYIRMSVSRMSGNPSSEEDHFPAVNDFVRQTLAQVPAENVKAQGERPYAAASETSIFAVKACLKNAVDQLQRDAMRGHVTVESTTSESNALAWRSDGTLTAPPVSQGVSPGTSDIVRDCLQMALDDFRGAVSRREFTREASDTTHLVRSYLERALKAVHSVMSQSRAGKLPAMSLSALGTPFEREHAIPPSSMDGQYDRKHVMSSKTETLTEEYVRRATSARYDDEWRDAFGSSTASSVVRQTLREALQTVEPSRSNTSALINAYIRQAVESVLTTDTEPCRWAERAGPSQQPSVSPSVHLINQYLQKACRDVDAARRPASQHSVPRRGTNGGSDSDAAAALVDAYMRAAIEDCETITAQKARPLQTARRPMTAPAGSGSTLFALRRGASQSDALSSGALTLSSNSSETVSDAGKRRRRLQRRLLRQPGQDTDTTKWTRHPAPPLTRKPIKAETKHTARRDNIVQTSRVSSATRRQNARPKSAKALQKPAHARDNEFMSTRTKPSPEAKKYNCGRPLQHKMIIQRRMIEKRDYTESTSSMNVDTPNGETVTPNESNSILSDEIGRRLRDEYRKVSELSDIICIVLKW